MKIFTLSLVALVAGLTVASGVHAQDNKPKDRRALLAEATAEAGHEKGMKMATAMIAGAKLYCPLADARFVMTGPSDLNGKKASTDYVEVVCENNLGYIVGERKDGAFVAYDCIEMSAKGGDGKDLPLKCKLAGNRAPPRGFQAQLDAAGIKCAIGGGRFIGFSPTATYYELSCSRADGLILTVATPRTATSAIKAVPCYLAIKSETPCTLTKPEQSEGFAKAAAEQIAKAADPAINRQKGMTMAPKMIAENQIPCQLTEANFVMTAKPTVNGKPVETDFVEIACENDLGYVLAHRKDDTFTAYDCIATSVLSGGQDHPLKCRLPGNAKPYAGLQAIMNASTMPCKVTNATLVNTSAKITAYEAACEDADGQFVVVSSPRIGTVAPQFVSCYSSLATAPCLLTSKEQSIGHVMALAAKAPKPCAATEQRFVTRAPTGSGYYEFACPDKTGFMVEASAAGAFVRAIPCAAAIRIAGGCKLTGPAAQKAG